MRVPPGADGRRVLVVGVSARAAVESAVRAGFAVTGLDAFGDADAHPHAPCLSLPRDLGIAYSARAAARASRGIACDDVAYLSNFENHPVAVAALARGRRLWGNPPAVLRRVRDPRAVYDVWRAHGVEAPLVAFEVPRASLDATELRDAPDALAGTPEQRAASRAQCAGRVDPRTAMHAADVTAGWITKPLASGGGRGVARWQVRDRVARPLPRGRYLQAFVEGTPASIAFVAAGGRAVPLGVSRQIVGDPRFGASGFRYCGNILAPADDPQFDHGTALVARAARVAELAADAFGLVGVNGIDLIARDGVPYPIEINPRWSASMELVDRAHGLPAFGLHARACESGALPARGLPVRGFTAVGKAIVFARQSVTLGDTHEWLADANLRDVPHSGERIAAGHAVCTVLASGADARGCYAALVARAATVYDDLARLAREAA